MDDRMMDLDLALMVDGNALAGFLYDVFAVDMTVALLACGSCGQEGQMGSLLAFTQAPGMVLCCPACHQIVLRIVVAPQRMYLDARGAAFLSIPRDGV